MQWTGNSSTAYGGAPYDGGHGYGAGYAQQPGYGYGDEQGYAHLQQPGYGYGPGHGDAYPQQPGYGYGSGQWDVYPQQPACGYPQGYGVTAAPAAMPAPQAYCEPWPQPAWADDPNGTDPAPRPGPATASPAARPPWPEPEGAAQTGPMPQDAVPDRRQPPGAETECGEAGRGEAEPGEAVRPVFVDSSGRRPHRVRRAARLMVIPAGGYVALLVSTVMGGPAVSAPAVPPSGDTAPTALPAAGADQPAGGTGSASAQQVSHLAAALPGSAAAPVAYRSGQPQATTSRR